MQCTVAAARRMHNVNPSVGCNVPAQSPSVGCNATGQPLDHTMGRGGNAHVQLRLAASAAWGPYHEGGAGAGRAWNPSGLSTHPLWLCDAGECLTWRCGAHYLPAPCGTVGPVAASLAQCTFAASLRGGMFRCSAMFRFSFGLGRLAPSLAMRN